MSESYSSRAQAALVHDANKPESEETPSSSSSLEDWHREIPIQSLEDDRRCLGYRGKLIIGNSQLSSSGFSKFFPSFMSTSWPLAYGKICSCDLHRVLPSCCPAHEEFVQKQKIPCKILAFNYCRTQFEVAQCGEDNIYTIYIPVECKRFLDRLQQYVSMMNKKFNFKSLPYIIPLDQLKLVIDMVNIVSPEDYQNMMRILFEEFDQITNHFSSTSVVFGAAISGNSSMARSAHLPVLNRILQPLVLRIRRRLTRAGFSLVNNHIARDLAIDIASVQQNNSLSDEPMEAFNAGDFVESTYDDQDEDDENFEANIPFLRTYKGAAIGEIVFRDIRVSRGLKTPLVVHSLRQYRGW